MIRFFAKEDQNGEVARHYERSKEVGFKFLSNLTIAIESEYI